MEHTTTTTTITCPHCNCTDLQKNGHRENGRQRWRCKVCKKSFQLSYSYSYKAREPGVKEQIDSLILNSSGVRDTARILGINKNTVIAHLKKTLQVNPYLLNKEEVQSLDNLAVSFHYTAEADEFWSYVGSKANQRWTWYAMDKHSGMILAWVNGKRTDESFEKLLDLLKDIPIGDYYTDDWGAYSRSLPKSLHTIGKDLTWKIERKNLNFRTHIKRLNRKTICFSKNEQIHDNVIGMYIEKYYYKSGTYGDHQPI